jgi:hypothetical protein
MQKVTLSTLRSYCIQVEKNLIILGSTYRLTTEEIAYRRGKHLVENHQFFRRHQLTSEK